MASKKVFQVKVHVSLRQDSCFAITALEQLKVPANLGVQVVCFGIHVACTALHLQRVTVHHRERKKSGNTAGRGCLPGLAGNLGGKSLSRDT